MKNLFLLFLGLTLSWNSFANDDYQETVQKIVNLLPAQFEVGVGPNKAVYSNKFEEKSLCVFHIETVRDASWNGDYEKLTTFVDLRDTKIAYLEYVTDEWLAVTFDFKIVESVRRFRGQNRDRKTDTMSFWFNGGYDAYDVGLLMLDLARFCHHF